jgi:hypothetical protein
MNAPSGFRGSFPFGPFGPFGPFAALAAAGG